MGAPLTRKYVNYRVACIVRIFKWAVEEELIPATVYQSLRTVTPFRKGRAKGVFESTKIKPVPEEHIPPVFEGTDLTSRCDDPIAGGDRNATKRGDDHASMRH